VEADGEVWKEIAIVDLIGDPDKYLKLVNKGQAYIVTSEDAHPNAYCLLMPPPTEQ
jgi:hypothetical protein